LVVEDIKQNISQVQTSSSQGDTAEADPDWLPDNEKLLQKVKKVNSVWQFSINLALHRYGKLTCHMGSHSITCQLPPDR